MNYQPYLIANYETGIDKRLQPWLSPDDSQEELFDGYVYRGTLSKRAGYNYLATGERGGTPYTESRIVTGAAIAAPATGVINSVNTIFTFTATPPVRVMSFVITGSNPVQTFTDNGLGFFFDGITQIGTINYATGAVSITLPSAPIAASTLTAIYASASIPDLPVMMIATFTTATNVKQLIVANTRDVNRYNTLTNRLDFLPHATTFTGTKYNFFSWVNYDSAADAPRLLFSNSVDPIQVYDGSTVADYVFTLTGVTTLSALLMFNLKDRLILLRTREDGTVKPKRIRISGTGTNSDVFDSSATGAGFIDIPDETWIMGAALNRDDLIIFTEQATWSLKYTGNDTTPFILVKLDESRGSKAPYAAISYLSRTTALSPRGMIITDGYRVERQDERIPNFSFDEIDPENFILCFAGSVDEDRDHYLIYPTPKQVVSQRILTTNYDEDNYAIYRLPLSCMGTYIFGYDVTWNDLLIYNNWDEFAAAYGNWESFSFSKDAPFSVGGGHHGEIWRLNVTGIEDNPVRIYNITAIDNTTIEVTTDWNNFSTHSVSTDPNVDPTLATDFIYLTNVGGMVEVNNQQFPILSRTDFNVFRLRVPQSGALSFIPYTSGGTASRVIPFSAQFKKFNPYINADKKVRCGWMYVYVDSTGTALQRPIKITGVTKSDPAVITTVVNHNLTTGDQVTIYSVGGMTEINGLSFYVTVISLNTFSLDDINSSGYTAYTSGGYASTEEKAKMVLDIITDDMDASENPVIGTATNLVFETGSKKWYKVYINQTGKFIQFRMRNQQAGAVINVQATMLGFAPVGRLI